MKRLNWKELGIDILVDLVAGLLIALGVYNIALNANFPVEGFFRYFNHSASFVWVANRSKSISFEHSRSNFFI